MSIIRFDNVDVIFAKDPREALGLLDQGMTRDQILKKPVRLWASKRPAWTSTRVKFAC